MEYNYDYTSQAPQKPKTNLLSVFGVIFTTMCALGILAPVICNFAIEGTISWALFPIAGVIFLWLVLVPVFFAPKGKLVISLAVFSILSIPFIYVMGLIIGNVDAMMYIGLRSGIAGIAYIWIVFTLFTVLKKHKRIAASITILLAIPLSIYSNYVVDTYLYNRFSLDIMEILGYAAVAVAAIGILFIRRKRIQQIAE